MDMVAGLRMGLVFGLSILALLVPNASPSKTSDSQSALVASASPSKTSEVQSETDALVAKSTVPRQADLGQTQVSDQLKRIAHWSAATHDHAAMPFVVVDKQAARLYVFDASARLQADTAVLIGSAVGDLSAPGVGLKAIADVQPEERTTPAGRFNGQWGRTITGEDVVWVDYDAAVSMHRVRSHQPKERRLQRLASETIEDNRISYGCINVPVDFFDTHLLPVFSTMAARVYVLPDHLTLEEVFGPLS